MTPTEQRIQSLAEACSLPAVKEWLGEITAADLREWLKAELGNTSALDDYHPHGPLLTRARAPRTILHIVSGNTPHAASQSLLRGLLLGSHNIIKLPSSGLAPLTENIRHFPDTLQELIVCKNELSDHDWAAADVVVAIGSDESIRAIHRNLQAGQTFIPHGHKVSIGVVLDDFANAAPLAAKDISLYEQQGCLSPHAIYVKGDSAHFARLLAEAMRDFALLHPPAPMDTSSAGAVRNLRETTRFTAANTPDTSLYESESGDSLAWTVIHEGSPLLKLSCLHRCVYVKPLPEKIDTDVLGPESTHLSTIALHPFNRDNALSFSDLPAHRICPLGMAQHPSLFWHHDGFAPLASMVTWQDIG